MGLIVEIVGKHTLPCVEKSLDDDNHEEYDGKCEIGNRRVGITEGFPVKSIRNSARKDEKWLRTKQ